METKRKFYIPAELILGLVAILAVVGTVWFFLQCVPYILAEQPVIAAPTEPSGAYGPIALAYEEDPQETIGETIPPEANPYTKKDFQYNSHNYLLCLAQESYAGVDVSLYQGDIDWEQVADSGIRFAMVRLGYRGWGQAGKLVEDENAKKNLAGARAAGLQVGAYFFSQATSRAEVDQEIEFMLNILEDFDLDMPIVLDWEIPVAEARTANMDPSTLTDMLDYFARVMNGKGFETMVYFNWNMSKNLLYLSDLEDQPFWLALYQDRMTFPYKVEMWQYTDKGRVPGIQGDVDINIYMP